MHICLLFAALLGLSVRAANDPLQPAAGEALLTKAEADKVLGDFAERFKASSTIKAHIVTERDDVMGKRKEEGELLLDRPGRMLRKFTKPSLKVWLLSGNELKLYIASRKTVYVTDFSKAPRALQLVRSAMTVDVKALMELFDVRIFSSSAGVTAFRLVLTKKEGVNSPGGYKLIQARIGEKDLFFNQIEFIPDGDQSDQSIEKYSEIQAVPKPADDAFKLDVPPDVKVEVDTVNAK